jgi:hypothetical protein
MAETPREIDDSLPSLPDFLLWLPENHTPRPVTSERWTWNKGEPIGIEALLMQSFESDRSPDPKRGELEWADGSLWWSGRDQATKDKKSPIGPGHGPSNGDISNCSEGCNGEPRTLGLWSPISNAGIWKDKTEKTKEGYSDWATTVVQPNNRTRSRKIPQIMSLVPINQLEQRSVANQIKTFGQADQVGQKPTESKLYSELQVAEECYANDCRLSIGLPGRKHQVRTSKYSVNDDHPPSQ